MARPVPRLFVIRHGETEWSLNGKHACLFSTDNVLSVGRHTGRTDIPLTEHGRDVVKSYATTVVCEGKLIDPKNLAHVFVSPRKRAHETFHLLFHHLGTPPPHTVTEDVREWDYGDYEGLKSQEINEKHPGWEIFRDGCPGGESPQDISNRIDSVIAKVREIHRQFQEDGIGARDVLIVAHGHLSRALITRWIEAPITLGFRFNIEPAGVVILSYNHKSLEEPCLDGLNLYAI